MARGGKRSGSGRPVSGDGRTGHLNLRMPETKLAAWTEAAARAGKTLTDWAEQALDREATMETIFCVVPVGTQDRYAAGYDGNRFVTREEAEAAIPDLRASGAEFDHDWDVIEVQK